MDFHRTPLSCVPSLRTDRLNSWSSTLQGLESCCRSSVWTLTRRLPVWQRTTVFYPCPPSSFVSSSLSFPVSVTDRQHSRWPRPEPVDGLEEPHSHSASAHESLTPPGYESVKHLRAPCEVWVWLSLSHRDWLSYRSWSHDPYDLRYPKSYGVTGLVVRPCDPIYRFTPTHPHLHPHTRSTAVLSDHCEWGYVKVESDVYCLPCGFTPHQHVCLFRSRRITGPSFFLSCREAMEYWRTISGLQWPCDLLRQS